MPKLLSGMTIVTKYIPATNFKGSRISATCELGRIIIPYDSQDSESEKQTHIRARNALLEKIKKVNGVQVDVLRDWAYGFIPKDHAIVHIHLAHNLTED
jgi:hypothetical protein